MKKWRGAAAICVNENNELLMVKQGKLSEEKCWSVPSGGVEGYESYEACCLRELKEETGYTGKIVKSLFVKHAKLDGFEVDVRYYEVMVIDGCANVQDPDGLIYDIDWKSRKEIETLHLSYPEDREMILNYIRGKENRGR
ncbi:NUDIX hydrolase [Virgibacillus sp. 179-BFC.A HS]|uniref:NUDIX hydrolase n=1 Tax=Tigheibacillus jepli TaxID=3035914 RepID=A0ABU5CGY3_9BACI|nr:NUDIX hydrolase [Virgibacillus sp. 179-BFC.A HS]MDY0405570.1 NUDIX hydrolase [Virgibacillus sp. 179-BFC.A HS]